MNKFMIFWIYAKFICRIHQILFVRVSGYPSLVWSQPAKLVLYELGGSKPKIVTILDEIPPPDVLNFFLY